MRYFKLLLAAMVMAGVCAAQTYAVEPGWYAPLDGSGQAITIRCNAADECAANWLTYRSRPLITVVNESTSATIVLPDNLANMQIQEQVWLQTTSLCTLGEVCTTELATTSGSWFGTTFEFSETQVFVELEPTADSLLIDFEAQRLLPDRCRTGNGGLILQDCIGVREFFLLAR